HRFLFINGTLEKASNTTHEKNESFLDGIVAAVDERGNQAEDLKVLDRAQEARNEAEQIRDYLEEIKNEWITETGGYDDEGQLLGFKDHETIAHQMITQKGGEELMGKLNEFVTQLNTISGLSLEPIAYDGKDHPTFSQYENQRKKKFANLFFENTPLAAGLATMTQFENEVLQYETEALEALADLVGAGSIDFDKIDAMVRPVSQRVAAGTKYEAELFIAASSSAFTPTMYFNGNEIPVDTSGIGRIEFTATPGEYDSEGLARKTYEAQIDLPLPGQGDTTFSKTIEYFVIKPTIQIQSQAVNALYFRCGNELSVQVPALGTAYNPTFTAQGADVVAGNQSGLVTLIPNGRKVTLSVYNDGNLIGNQEFDVRAVPRPEVQIQMGGRQLQAKQGIRTNQLRDISAVVIPDADFKRLLPNDARYKVAEWTVTLASGPRPKGEPLRFTSGEGSLSRLRQSARSGDRLVIEVKKVLRLNYQNRQEEVAVNVPPISIPIN
ncbi:MAG: gliding motility protein GldM, partial [Bacteroidota bacterium]